MPVQAITKLAYQTLQQGKGIAGLFHKELSTKLMSLMAPDVIPNTSPISPQLFKKLRLSIEKLEQIDWKDAEDGLYPKRQLFEAPWIKWAKYYPLIWLDLPSTWGRRRKRSTREIPKQIDPEIYPDYYLQNFHHQTDGYLSDYSANLYDLQVEILFNGTADAMRRRIIAPLKRGLKRFSTRNSSNIRVLDIATGTGRTLKQIRAALPKVELIGLDLSNAYLKQASKSLSAKNNELPQLIRGNAEDLPFAKDTMQGVTCVFLLHELPQKARENVLKNCWEVIEPGGVLVLADSIQLSDSPDFEKILKDFPKVFHEPYYIDYINQDINALLEKIGFSGVTSESYFMTKVWTAHKPIDN